MGVSVSKADALIEMVRAFESQDERKARKIGTIISSSMKRDSKNGQYSEFIELDRESKQLFPQKLRKNTKYVFEKESAKEKKVAIKLKEGNYVIEITEEVKIVQEKN